MSDKTFDERASYGSGPKTCSEFTAEEVFKMNFEGLISLTEQWFDERGIGDKLSMEQGAPQFKKVIEEASEIGEALIERDQDKLMDAVGDTLITLIGFSKQQGLSLRQCLRLALLQIKDRKGKKINGVFVKEEDLPKE